MIFPLSTFLNNYHEPLILVTLHVFFTETFEGNMGKAMIRKSLRHPSIWILRLQPSNRRLRATGEKSHRCPAHRSRRAMVVAGEFSIDYNYDDLSEADPYEQQGIWEYK